MLSNNFIALGITLALALLWLRMNDAAAHRGWINSSLSRKIIHIGTGPIFVLCWLLFNSSPSARFLAAIIPLGITLQFLLVGLGVMRDPSAVQAMSRSGSRAEILRGPLYYGLMFVALTLIYWKDSPIGIVALMLLCGGDGLADIVGNQLGKAKIPWSPKKSWAGTLTVFAGGLLFSILILEIFNAAGALSFSLAEKAGSLVLISLAGAVVESLPFSDIDNITVPLTAVVLGYLLF